jgi:hypothetical protein
MGLPFLFEARSEPGLDNITTVTHFFPAETKR